MTKLRIRKLAVPSGSRPENHEAPSVARKDPLYDQVEAQLRQIIDEDSLKPGDRLMSERELAERLGVSRSPVRHAITALRALGLVEVKHGDGIYLLRTPNEFVSSMAREVVEVRADLPDVWEVRQPLEAQAAGLAARRRTAANLKAMQTALASMERAVNQGGNGVVADRQFHQSVWEAAQNTLLLTTLLQLSVHLDRASEESLSQPGQPSRSLSHHLEIFKAIETGNQDLARLAMLFHLQATSYVPFVRRKN
jgi:GntR family transcriptional regulator, transcriptional repressor for pyruvate dehydrogenase complex